MGIAARLRVALIAALVLAIAVGWSLGRDTAKQSGEAAKDEDPAGTAPGQARVEVASTARSAAGARLAAGSNPGASARAGDVQVTVETEEGDRRSPAVGVLVTASAPDERERWHTFFELRTGTDGRVHVPTRGGALEVTAIARGYLGSSMRMGAPEPSISLVLRRLATVVVRARDDLGAASAGVEIGLLYQSKIEYVGDLLDPTDRVPGTGGYLRKTDTKGVVVFDGLVPNWKLLLEGPRSVFGPMHPVEPLDLEPGERREIDVVVGTPVSLRVRLVDSKGAPVKRGELVLTDTLEAEPFVSTWAEAETELGVAVIGQVQPGRAFALHGTGWNEAGDELCVYEFPHLLAAPRQALDLGDGRPAEEALVVGIGAEPGAATSRSLDLVLQRVRLRLSEPPLSDISTAFSASALPGRTIRFCGLSRGAWTAGLYDSEGHLACREEHEVQVPRSGAPLDILLAAPGGEPEAARLAVTLSGPELGAGWIQYIREGRTLRVESFLVGDPAAEKLPPGRYRVLAVAGEYSGQGDVVLTAGGAADLDLALSTPLVRVRAPARFSGGKGPFGGQEGKWYLAEDWRRSELRAVGHEWSVASGGTLDLHLPSGLAIALVIHGPVLRGVAILPAMEPGAVRKDDVVFVEP